MDGSTLKEIKRMCDIVLNTNTVSSELDSLALSVGHHPDVLNLPTLEQDLTNQKRTPALTAQVQELTQALSEGKEQVAKLERQRVEMNDELARTTSTLDEQGEAMELTASERDKFKKNMDSLIDWISTKCVCPPKEYRKDERTCEHCQGDIKVNKQCWLDWLNKEESEVSAKQS